MVGHSPFLTWLWRSGGIKEEMNRQRLTVAEVSIFKSISN